MTLRERYWAASQFLQYFYRLQKNIFCRQQGGCGLCVTDLVASHVGADVQGALPSPLDNVDYYYMMIVMVVMGRM